MTVDVDRRKGRGRLSAIELMLGDHPDAEPDVLWANTQLRDRTMPQVLILVELNDRLVAKGIPPISKSSFNRYSVRTAIQFRKLDEVTAIAGELIRERGAEDSDNVTNAVAELAKLRMFELLEDGKLDSKSTMEIGRGLSSVVSAQKGSAEHRRKLQDELLAKVDKAIEKASADGAAGADAEAVLKRIRQDVYGIFER